MNKLFLMRNPELFQGENYLNKSKNYFEGWYFKQINNDSGIAFIPGISISNNEKYAFIQIIKKSSSYFIKYNINDFTYNYNPFCIKIGNNTFSKSSININIRDKKQNLNILGKIKYSNIKNISTNIFCPNIMGPFSYIPFMECNHSILSMKNKTHGLININNDIIDFNNGIGYIEKDWGYSFPQSYIWCQGNNFEKSNSSFMLAIADIPFKLFKFRGIICILIINNKEYKFTTYNNTKLIKYDINKKFLNITINKDNYTLNIASIYDSSNKLYAPIKGKMEKNIFESISSTITVTLKKDNNIIFSDTSTNCGLEIV